MTDRPFVSGVILAAGRSSRLGRPKQLLPLRGEPLLRHVVRNALAAELDEVILVLGHEAEVIAAAVGNLGQRTVINPDYALGQSTSLRAGITALDPASQAALVLLGDQPGIDAAALDLLIGTFRAHGDPLVVPTYGGRPGNPVLFARSLFGDLLTVTGDRGAREVVRANLERARQVTMPDGDLLRDIDTDADYASFLRALRSDPT